MYVSFEGSFYLFRIPVSHFVIPLQIKKKLPKINRTLAKELLENEEAENMEDVDGVDAKKISKKKKGLTADILKDERFGGMFANKVYKVFTMTYALPSVEEPVRNIIRLSWRKINYMCLN